jgi:hypothetical protein
MEPPCAAASALLRARTEATRRARACSEAPWGDRFSVDAQINSASRETVVLWDGYDGSRTIAVRLPAQGMASRLGGVFGKSRYELALERLNELRRGGATVSFTMRCEGPGQAPMADRFSYFDQGRRVQFEF